MTKPPADIVREYISGVSDPESLYATPPFPPDFDGTQGSEFTKDSVETCSSDIFEFLKLSYSRFNFLQSQSGAQSKVVETYTVEYKVRMMAVYYHLATFFVIILSLYALWVIFFKKTKKRREKCEECKEREIRKNCEKEIVLASETLEI